MQLLVKTRKATRSEHVIVDHDLYSMNYNKDEGNDEDPYKQLSHKNDDFDKIDCKHVPEIFSFLQAYFVLLLMMNQSKLFYAPNLTKVFSFQSFLQLVSSLSAPFS